MSIHNLKAKLKDIIEATDDEAILQRWKTLLEKELEQYRQQLGASSQRSSAADTDAGQDDTSGYSILESGLGIDE